jgi:hypothetical protein
MSNDDLILHLPFDQLDPTNLDRSIYRRPARLIGTPVRELDSTVTTAARFSGQDGLDLVLAGLGGGNAACTVSAWVRLDALPKRRAWILSLGEPRAGAQHWLVNASGKTRIGVWSGARVKPDIPIGVGVWRHWAASHDGAAMTVYSDGKPVGGPIAAKLDLGETVLRVASPPIERKKEEGFVGALAHLRVHARALDAAEIAALIEADRTPLAAFESGNPLDGRLLDANDRPVLYIEDGPTGEDLALELFNVSTRTLVFSSGPMIRTRLSLGFRPGTLSPATVGKGRWGLRLRDDTDWELSKPFRAKDGSMILSLLSRGADRRLAHGESAIINFENVSAAAGEGARVSRVELSYEGVSAEGLTDRVSGRRAKSINIASHAGRPHAPLRFSFRDQGAVLPGADQRDNVVRLSITNVSPDRPIRFLPPPKKPGDPKGSELALSVEAELDGETRPAALGKVSEVKAIAVSEPEGWTLSKEGMDSVRPSWVLTPDSIVDLEPGEHIDLRLSNITTTNTPGRAPIRLMHRRIPGFWDGGQSLEIRKSPIHFDLHGQAGIGERSPSRPLTVRAQRSTQEWLSLATLEGKTVWHLNHHSGDGLNVVESGVADGRLFLRDGGRGVGIGLVDPDRESDLHISGKTATTVVVEARTKSDKGPKLELRESGASDGSVSASLALEGDNLLLDATSGGIAIEASKDIDVTAGGAFKVTASSFERFGCDAFGAYVSDPGDNRKKDGRIALAVYGGSVFHDAVWLKSTVFIDSPGPQRATAFDRNAVRNYLSASTFNRGWSLHRNIESKDLNGDDFLLISTEHNGMAAINDGSDAPYPIFVWNIRGIDVHAGLTVRQNAIVRGNLSVHGTKNFVTPHPSNPGADLIHACLEGPENGVYYRGEAELEGGHAVVTLPNYFEALTRTEGRTVHLTAKGREPFLLSYEDVVDGRFTVHGTKPDGRFSWEVRAVRADLELLEPEPEPDSSGSR